MKIACFHLMPYRDLEPDFDKKYDKQINGIPLKLLVQNYCSYGPASEMEHMLEKMNNHNQIMTPSVAVPLP